MPDPVTFPQAPFPSGPIRSVLGTAVVVAGDDIDTDRIIPARFLKCVSFEGLGEQVFADDRLERQGDHPFDQPARRRASILLVNRNFGCGSSREHAPQALMRWGIRAVVGESFAEIFLGNCLALGLPCVTLEHGPMLALQAEAESDPATPFHLGLDPLGLVRGDQHWAVETTAGTLQMLLSGQWDATAQLLARERDLCETAARLPYLQAFGAR